MTKTIAYIRVSTDKQADLGHSLKAQQEKIEAYAKLYDLELIDTVVEAESAKNLNREGLKGALELLKTGKAEALIVVKLDRLTRSVADLGHLVETYFNKAALLSVSEQIDTRSASGRLVLNVLASVSQWEREAIGERTSAAMQSMKLNNLYTGGHVPYGKMIQGGDLVENPYELEIIALATDLKAKGLKLREIAGVLSEQGYMSRKDREFIPKQVSRMVA